MRSEVLVKEISDGKYGMCGYHVLHGLFLLNNDVKLYQKINQHITERLYSGDASGNELRALLESALLMSDGKDEHTAEKLSQFVSHGRIFYYLQMSIEEKRFDEVALCLITILANYTNQVTVDYKEAPRKAKANSGLQMFRQILDQDWFKESDILSKIGHYMGTWHRMYLKMFEALVSYGSDEIGVRILRYFIKNFFGADKIMATKSLAPFVFTQSYTIRQSLDGLDELFTFYVLESMKIQQLSAIIKDISYDYKNRDHRSFAAKILDMGLADSEFVSWIFGALHCLNQEEWQQLIVDSALTAEIVRSISIKFGRYFGDQFMQSLEKIGREMIESGSTPEYRPERISRYAQGLDPDLQVVFRRNIRDLLIDRASYDVTNFLMYFGEILKDCEIMREKVDDFLRRFLFRKIEQPTVAEINWCIDIIKDCRLYDARKKGVKGLRKVLCDRLRERMNLEETQPDVRILFGRLIDLFE